MQHLRTKKFYDQSFHKIEHEYVPPKLQGHCTTALQ